MRRVVFLAICVLGFTGRAWGAGDGEDLPTPKSKATPQVSGEAKYNEGLAFTRKQDWRRAEMAYREATKLTPELPEAWNELGHALKNLGRFEESIQAYEEALRLRPNYAQALEYLGEAYVLMRQLDKARALHARLEPLDTRLAQQLASAIQSGSATW